MIHEKKRRTQQMITKITDESNVQLCKQKDIMKSFHDFYSQSFGLTHTTASSFVFDPPNENKITKEDKYTVY